MVAVVLVLICTAGREAKNLEGRFWRGNDDSGGAQSNFGGAGKSISASARYMRTSYMYMYISVAS